MINTGAHGDFEFTQIEGVILIYARGSWNIECAEEYIQFAESYYESSKALNMDLVIDVTQLDGMTPDAAQRLNRYNHLCQERGMFKSQVYYNASSRIWLQLALSLLQVVDSRQAGIRTYDELSQYLTERLSPEGVHKALSFLIQSSEKNPRSNEV